MASLLEYFKNDFKGISVDQTLTLTKGPNEIVEVKQRIQYDLTSCAKFMIYYVPDIIYTYNICWNLLSQLDKLKEVPEGDWDIAGVNDFSNDVEIGTPDVVYSSKVYFYIENDLTEEELKDLDILCKEKKLYVTIRSKTYIKIRMERDKPLAFISHDSKDKELIARQIASELESRLCPVWYDEYSLQVGDSLRESIEKGIKEAKKCILILTPNFLSNPGWGKKEFNSIFTREMIMSERIVLPVWYKVSPKDVYEYSPALADTLALNWPDLNQYSEEQYKVKVQQLISKLHTVITS